MGVPHRWRRRPVCAQIDAIGTFTLIWAHTLGGPKPTPASVPCRAPPAAAAGSVPCRQSRYADTPTPFVPDAARLGSPVRSPSRADARSSNGFDGRRPAMAHASVASCSAR